MFVPVAQVIKGAASFLDKELIPMIPDSGWQRVLAGAAMSIMLKRSESYVDTIKEHPAVKMMKIFDETGANVDLDLLHTEIKKQVSMLGDQGMTVDIPMLGTITMRAADIDKLKEHITQFEIVKKQ